MRIIGGMYRSRYISAPSGREVRPTPERAREGLFSILGGTVEGHTFLDLYAGAGTVGLEAVSRGAERAIFVERDRQALAALRGNIQSLACEDRCEILEQPVDLLREEVYGRATLIFLDPPYGPEPSLPNLRRFLETTPRTPLVIFQWDARLRGPKDREHSPSVIPARMPLLDERRYGRTGFSLYYEEVA